MRRRRCGQVAAAVVGDGPGNVEALPSEALEPPGEIGVLAIEKEVGVEDARQDPRGLQRLAPVEAGRAAGAEDLLFHQVPAGRLLPRAPVEVPPGRRPVDPRRVEPPGRVEVRPLGAQEPSRRGTRHRAGRRDAPPGSRRSRGSRRQSGFSARTYRPEESPMPRFIAAAKPTFSGSLDQAHVSRRPRAAPRRTSRRRSRCPRRASRRGRRAGRAPTRRSEADRPRRCGRRR